MTEYSLSDIPSQEEAHAMECVFEELVSSICVEVACGMHRLAKTGVIPYSDIMIPRNFDPNHGDGDDGEGGGGGRQGKKRKILNGDGSEGGEYSVSSSYGDKQYSTKRRGSGWIDSNNESDDDAASAPPVTRGSQLDVWSRVPPKDPGNVLCSICGRQVNALRFAPHLDKCMGMVVQGVDMGMVVGQLHGVLRDDGELVDCFRFDKKHKLLKDLV
eukprot:CAMPEP_0185734312 /NCGR_PEP_ID=MMETSP1171-20130828/22122_1 /TAXON_ID=374046 /ORGANISM="Helicotheca tamensis, Strain CCMP826" /LENGTH=214 /DNA_ID=CAMNT_0028404273 /DNA_START=4 /DNA_END=645 /DNA_ORIENTATION=-